MSLFRAETLHFAGRAAVPAAAPLADYNLPSAVGTDPWFGAVVAGLVGALVAFAAAWAMARVLTSDSSRSPQS